MVHVVLKAKFITLISYDYLNNVGGLKYSKTMSFTIYYSCWLNAKLQILR